MKRKPIKPGSERQITLNIRQLLRFHNIFHWKQWQGQFSEPGVADIIGIYQGKPLAIEIKTSRGKLSEIQADWLGRFAQAGGIVIIARSPEDVAEALKLPGLFTRRRTVRDFDDL
jgi:hypothetical protein